MTSADDCGCPYDNSPRSQNMVGERVKRWPSKPASPTKLPSASIASARQTREVGEHGALLHDRRMPRAHRQDRRGRYHDITKRKQAEKATGDAYAELRAIFDGTANGMWVVDLDHNVLRMNNPLRAMLGLKRRTCGQKMPRASGRQRLCDSTDCPVGRIAGGAERWEGRDGEALPDGTKSQAHREGGSRNSAEGRLLGMIDKFVDVTARKQAEEALRQAAVEDGVRRAAGRWDRPRLQQSPDGHSGYAALALQQMGVRAARTRTITHISELADRAANLVRQLLDLQPAAAHGARGARPERAGRQTAAACCRASSARTSTWSSGPGRRPGARPGRPRPDRAGDHEPGGERPRRHARGRQAHHRDRQRRSRARSTPPRTA